MRLSIDETGFVSTKCASEICFIYDRKSFLFAVQYVHMYSSFFYQIRLHIWLPDLHHTSITWTKWPFWKINKIDRECIALSVFTKYTYTVYLQIWNDALVNLHIVCPPPSAIQITIENITNIQNDVITFEIINILI